MSDEIDYSWRGPISDDEMVALVESHGGRPAVDWWDRIRPVLRWWGGSVTRRYPAIVTHGGSR